MRYILFIFIVLLILVVQLGASVDVVVVVRVGFVFGVVLDQSCNVSLRLELV